MSRVILVTGATGSQGGSVIRALLSDSKSAQQYTIVGLTRDPTSTSAQLLAAKGVKVIQGNFDNISAIFRAAQNATSRPVWGVFSVQVATGKGQDAATEEIYGKGLVDASLAHGVRHFIQASVDRGGDSKSWTSPTSVPHFASKHRIELHLRDRAAQAKGAMTWTVLRPVAFMDNIVPSFETKAYFAAWRDVLGANPLQLVATEDIGKIAAQAFLNPESADYRNQAVGVAGDELSFEQLNEIFLRRTGLSAPVTYGFVGAAAMWWMTGWEVMLSWFKTDGYGVDIQKVKRLNPDVMDFETWLVNKSKFETN